MATVQQLLSSFNTGASSNDPFFANVVSLLHFDGADGSSTFTDQIGKVWTRNGAAEIDTAQSKFGGASLVLSGTSQFLTTPHHTDFNLGASDFTIEAWVRPTATGTIIAKRTTSATQSGWAFIISPSGGDLVLRFASWIGSGGTTLHSITGTIPISTTSFTHAAITRSGNDARIFVDGVADGTQTVAGTIASNTNVVYIGSTPQLAHYTGHIDDVRVTPGVARYTANFTPPTTAYPDA
jgi:hypothetical protein